MWRYWLAAGLALIFLILPIIYLVLREVSFKKAGKEEEKKKTGGVEVAPKPKKPFDVAAFIKVVLVLVPFCVPMVYFSTLSYSFYGAGESLVKVAFKHSGDRKVDCDESELIREAGARYRRELKDSKQVAMDIAQLAHCPRERFPVYVELTIDDEKVIDREYPPTGIKKDLASYIYKEIPITPGRHRFRLRISGRGDISKPEHTIEKTVDVKTGEIVIIYFDNKTDSLLLE